MHRTTTAKLVELEECLIDEGVPEEEASNFIDRIEKEIEDLLQTLDEEDEDDEEKKGGEG